MRYALLLIALAFAPAASASTWYVDGSGSGGFNPGTSWASAFFDIQQALAVADSLDEVWVAAGEYKPTAGHDREISFVIPSGVSLYGGFAGGETDRIHRDWILNPSVLSGNISLPGDNRDNSYNVVKPGAGATLDGFTIRDGYGDGPAGQWRRGAGIYNTSAEVTVRHCLVTLNQIESGGMGAGLYTEGANATIEDCEFSYNDAIGLFSNGGGATATASQMISSVFRRVVFRNNTSGSDGGGLFHGSLAEDCSFIDNQSGGYGGGSYWVYTVTNSYYEGNNSSLGGGGAAYGLLISDSEFTQNSAQVGGGIYAPSETQRCLVYGNSAENGGGVYLSIGQIHDSVVFNNTATEIGGGILTCTGCAAGTATNVTVVNNIAAAGGGAAFGLTMVNSIMWGNDAPTDPSFHAAELFGVATFSYSLIDGSNGSGPGWQLDAVDGGGNIDGDPLFLNVHESDLHVGPTSPALDAGSDALVLGDTDVEGNPRIQGGAVDMGAYEAAVIVAAPEMRSSFLRGYPNPFNPTVTIEFALASKSTAKVTIYNVAGQAIRTLWEGPVSTVTQLSWDGKDDAGETVGSGVYFARLVAPGLREAMKLVLVK